MSASPRWSEALARTWYQHQPWRIGCNFTPSTAANQLEFWQADSFDMPTLQRELDWAKQLGFNSLRVFLHDLAFQTDPDGFLSRLDRFLAETEKRRIRPMLVFFDDCWNPDPRPGPQPAPIPGVHNSRWWQSPGVAKVNDPETWPALEKYLKAVMRALGGDDRVLAWDLYNEPGNSNQGSKSLPFLKEVFAWAQEVDPAQPLTCGVWNWDLAELNQFQLEHSDILSFHHYKPADDLEKVIAEFKAYNRPLMCTEYMARGAGCTFQTHLPVFQREEIACYNWGFVKGKTQTHLPWGSKENGPEPEIWFHEIFHPDGRPYRADEVELIKKLTRI